MRHACWSSLLGALRQVFLLRCRTVTLVEGSLYLDGSPRELPVNCKQGIMIKNDIICLQKS